MGRKQSMSPDQKAEAERRIASGEGLRKVAAAFGVSPATMSRNVSKQSQQVKIVAEQVAAAQTALAQLPVQQQHHALSLAEKLRGISDNLAAAAYHGAANASRLGRMASAELAKVPEGAPLDGQAETLKSVAALSRMSSEAASLPMALVTAQKDQVKRANAVPMETRTLDTKLLSSQALRELLAARGG